jgi:DNA-binding transcriptional ArsR family regulator
MFQNLDPLLHSQLRLAIISLLVTVEEAEFSFIKEKTNASAGNISVQLEKLQEAKYIKIEKTFKGKYPLTKCSITKKGVKAFEDYVKILQQYIKPDKNTKS